MSFAFDLTCAIFFFVLKKLYKKKIIYKYLNIIVYLDKTVLNLKETFFPRADFVI